MVMAMDYGQFVINGGAMGADSLALLDQAEVAPPSAGDGSQVLVLSPHQNNFAMTVAVERWSSPPPSDVDAWEQVSVEAVEVDGSGAVWLESPTLESTSVAMEAGRYWVEISGRGFVNYGWPGSTEPGDEWRLRFWPVSDAVEHPRQLWTMPGYGTPWDADV
ncbi:hypothetical protein C8046_08625 [Serinibacter arcticus]|uniref:Uncharacterized protein n=1 Tax=Serinibacter arcticus TaxID=1655435 RepID=A0A2U1ZZQ7_9MICO|nr:hypothetical protein C8046_08625 [Serinibacter arcticus]